MRNLFLIFLLFSCFGGFAQPNTYTEKEEKLLKSIEEKISKEPKEAIPLLNQAKKKAKKSNNETLYYEIIGIEVSFYLEARQNLERALVLTDSLINQTISEKLIAKGYSLKGTMQLINGDLEDAIDLYQKALLIFQKEKDKAGIAYVNKSMGNLAYFSVNYKEAIKYYKNTLDVLDEINPSNADIYNNISRAYFSLGIQDSASYYNDKLKEVAFEANDSYLKFMVYLNDSEIASKSKNHQKSLENLNEALKTAKLLDNPSMEAIVYQMRALSYSYLNNLDMAEKDHLTAMEMMETLNMKIEYYRTQKGLIEIYKRQKKYKEAFEELEKYNENYKIEQETTIKEATKEFQIKYETEKKERQIAEQELKIQKKSVQMKNWLIAGIIIIGGLLTFFFIMRRNQKNKLKIMEKEKENEVLSARVLGEEVERSRISKELHDGIASNLVAVKLQVENNAEISQKILSLVQETHKEVRQIAHNLMPIDFEKQNLVDVIKSFCEECTTDNRPVNFQTNVEKINLDKDRSMVLYRTVQEFIQNAIKYSQAKQIDVLLMENEGVITLNIEDNGIGFDTKLKETSKGLSGVIERLEKIKGRINIDSSDRGTSVFISIKP